MKGDVKQGFTRRYWTHEELAQGLYLSRGHLYRLLEDGAMLPPDVMVAPKNFGWEPVRAQRFGVETKRLDDKGRPVGPPPGGGLAEAQGLIRARYSVTPVLYLSSWHASYLYGLQRDSVYFMRQRNSFIPADVQLGKAKFGWSEPRLIEFGRQTGRLDDEKISHWVVRRTEEFGLPPTTPWVRDWLKHAQEQYEAAGHTGTAPLMEAVEKAAGSTT